MTDEYIRAVIGYTKSMVYTKKSFADTFTGVVYFNKLIELTFDIHKPLTKNDAEYVSKMYDTLKTLNGSIQNTKYNIFIDFVYKVMYRYSQSEDKVGDSPNWKLSKDALEFMNMLHRQDVPFLDGVL